MATTLIEFKIPTLTRQVFRQDFPLGVDFLGVTDDGIDIIVLYCHVDDSETRTKERTLEVFANIDSVPQEGRNFLGFLPTNHFTVWENTENTVPDNQVA